MTHPSRHTSHPLGPASEQVDLHELWQATNVDNNKIQLNYNDVSMYYVVNSVNPLTPTVIQKLLEIFGRVRLCPSCSFATALDSDINQTTGSGGHLSMWENRCMHAAVCLLHAGQPRSAGGSIHRSILVGHRRPNRCQRVNILSDYKPRLTFADYLGRLLFLLVKSIGALVAQGTTVSRVANALSIPILRSIALINHYKKQIILDIQELVPCTSHHQHEADIKLGYFVRPTWKAV